MDNAEEVLRLLEEFSKRKNKTIPPELDDYLVYVARTGDPVFQWPMIKSLIREKLLNVLSDFHETTGMDIPSYPNVEPFMYDTMKEGLLERFDLFVAAPFTVQRIAELLMYPRKQYNRIDKYMRAFEKNIFVVSTREPGAQRPADPENGGLQELMGNGSDFTVDVEMEDVSHKEKSASNDSKEPQPGSSDISVRRLLRRPDTTKKSKDKKIEYESIPPPEINVSEEPPSKITKLDLKKEPEKTDAEMSEKESMSIDEKNEPENKMEAKVSNDTKNSSSVSVPKTEDDVDMTEEEEKPTDSTSDSDNDADDKSKDESQTKKDDEIKPEKSSKNSKDKDEIVDNNGSPPEKPVESSEIEELMESSSENSSSSDGNMSSPKNDEDLETVLVIIEQEDTNERSNGSGDTTLKNESKSTDDNKSESSQEATKPKSPAQGTIQDDNYSISDVKSEIPPAPQNPKVSEEPEPEVSSKTELIEKLISSEDSKEAEDPAVPTDSQDSLESDNSNQETVLVIIEDSETDESTGEVPQTPTELKDPKVLVELKEPGNQAESVSEAKKPEDPKGDDDENSVDDS